MLDQLVEEGNCRRAMLLRVTGEVGCCSVLPNAILLVWI